MYVYNYVFMTMLPWVGSRQASQNKLFWFTVCVIAVSVVETKCVSFVEAKFCFTFVVLR